MRNTKRKFSAKQLRVIRFGGVSLFIGTFIFAFIFTGNDSFLKRCIANGNSVKYCDDIYDDRNLAFKEKKFIEKKKFDIQTKNLLFKEEIYRNGNLYFGQFLNDKPNGFGTLIDKHGGKYIGQWKNGKMHGQGKYIWGPKSKKKILFIFKAKSKKSGDKYIGQWKNGEMHGHGSYIWGPNSKKSGYKYIGEWVNSKKSGFGKLISSDGEIYIGEFLNNKKHGQGISISSGKEKEFGEWENGKKI